MLLLLAPFKNYGTTLAGITGKWKGLKGDRILEYRQKISHGQNGKYNKAITEYLRK
jgi:hypothetical protein